MVSAKAFQGCRTARIMMVGYPKSGKTGSLACLVNAGFKLRILDFDGNLDVLFQFCDEDKLENIDYVPLEDKMRMGAKVIEPSGLPSAFPSAMKMLDRWKYDDPETGEEVDLGQSKSWGPDTIVVLDSLTSMGDAAMRYALAMANRNSLNTRDSDWGVAMGLQSNFIERLTSKTNRHHVIVLAHLKMVGPRDVRKGDDDLTETIKKREGDLVETRLYPSALGRQLPPVIGGHFPTLLQARVTHKHGKMKRTLTAVPRPELDLGVPVPDLPDNLTIEDGMLEIMERLTGSVENCLKAS